MYSCLIKKSNILSFVCIIFAACFSHPTQASASVLVASNIDVERTLQYGMRGSDIIELQEELRTFPSVYPSGKVTGYFGRATLAAVTHFQKQEQANLQSTSSPTKLGIVDMHTGSMIRLRVTQKKCPLDMRARQSCLEKNYTHYANNSGVDSALSLLRLEVSNEPRFAGACHSVMHRIAHVAVHEFKNFGNAMYHGTPLCQNGYYHGVVEEYLRNENVDVLTPTDLRNFCSKSLAATSSVTDTLNCIHGIGHALMYMTRNDLPKSLVRCGDFLDDHMRSQCLTGAFMQEGFMATSSKQSVIDNEVLGCTQSQEQDQCFINLSAKTMSEAGINANEIAHYCDTLKDVSNQQICKSAIVNSK